MKKVILLASLCTLLLSSCGNQTSSSATALGSPYELVVVCDQAKWDGPVGDTLRSFLTASVPMISRVEPRFDIMRVTQAGYNKLILKQRSHLVVLTGDKFEKPALSIKYDVYASGQLVITVTAPDNASLADYLSQKSAEIVTILLRTERERRVNYLTHNPAPSVIAAVSEKFGLNISIPKGFTVRNGQPADFTWMSNETNVSQGVVIYSYPYTDGNDFLLDSLVAKRNKFMALIPGSVDGSYMATADVMPQYDTAVIGDRNWARLSGFWDVEGDFMGGPMRNYSFYDQPRNRIVAIDFYVYSPNIKQRNFLWDTENIIHTVEFPQAVE